MSPSITVRTNVSLESKLQALDPHSHYHRLNLLCADVSHTFVSIPTSFDIEFLGNPLGFNESVGVSEGFLVYSVEVDWKPGL